MYLIRTPITLCLCINSCRNIIAKMKTNFTSFIMPISQLSSTSSR